MKKSALAVIAALSMSATPAFAVNYYYKTPAADTIMPSSGPQGIVGVTLPKGTWAITANAEAYIGVTTTNFIDCFIAANGGAHYGTGTASIGGAAGSTALSNLPLTTVITIASTQIVSLGCSLEYAPPGQVKVVSQGTYLTATQVILK